MKRSLSLLLFVILAACKTGDGDSDQSTLTVSRPPSSTEPAVPISGGGTMGNNPFPWNRYFVTEFDQIRVQAIRDSLGFVANNFGGRRNAMRSNPLAAARLDYALSTGLTGAGQVVSMIDSSMRLTHEQFAGKTIYSSGNPPPAGDRHGTAVASVMAGTGANGGTLGFAPAADIHQGYLNYSEHVDWNKLGIYMDHARQVGAIVSNNSWGLADLTVQDRDPATYFSHSSYGHSSVKPYVDGLKAFANDGVIVFALQNDYHAVSASLIAALPLGAPELEPSWITVINAVPEFDDDRILSAQRISTACLETARFCMAANGQIMVARETGDRDYENGVGASFAAPQVAGSVALLAEAFPDLTAPQLRDRLLATADNGFFDHTGWLTFAPGITHGYNSEFGHGFLDLRSALLPIGQAEVTMASGQSIDLGTAAITSGPATGDGLARSLAALTVLSTDQLYGRFEVSADVLADADSRIDPAGIALAAAIHPDSAAGRSSLNAAIRSGSGLAGHRGAWSDPTAAALLGSAFIPLTAPDNAVGVAVLNGNGTSGLALHQTFDLAGGNLQVGLAAMRTDGSIMGVSVPHQTGEVSSSTNALQIEYASRIATNTALRLNAETGFASGDGAGMVNNFSTVSYNRIGLALEQADVGQSGDVLTMFVRRPLGITRGSAEMDLPMQFASGQTTFTTTDVSLAPVERQLDLGFEYSTPISRTGNVSLGMLHSTNDGNSLGRQAMSGFVGFQFTF